MDFKPGWFGWVKDDFTAHLTLGEALGRLPQQQHQLRPGDQLRCARHVRLVRRPDVGGGGGGDPGQADLRMGRRGRLPALVDGQSAQQHQRRLQLPHDPGWRFSPSNVVGAAQSGAMNKTLKTFHANLIWNPVSSVDVGLEYMWGERTVVNNGHGTENVLISKFAFRF